MRKWIFFDSIKSILENVRHKNMGISPIDLCVQSHFFRTGLSKTFPGMRHVKKFQQFTEQARNSRLQMYCK